MLFRSGAVTFSYSQRPNMRFEQTTTNLTSSYTWSWNSSPAVTAATGTTSVTNTSGAQVSQTFTATATIASTGCSSSLTSSAVTINSTIATPTGTDSTQCGTGVPTCSVTGSATIGKTFKWYLVSTGGTALASQTASALSGYSISATTLFYCSKNKKYNLH